MKIIGYNQFVNERMKIMPITNDELDKVSLDDGSIEITDEIKEEVEEIIHREIGAKVEEWIIKDKFATTWDDTGSKGVVFKSEKDAIDQLLKNDIDNELESLEQLFTDVDALIMDGMSRNDAERLVKSGNSEEIFRQLIKINGPEFSYSQCTGERFDLKNGYVFYY